MNSKTISVLAAAAISIGLGFAFTSSATAALAMDAMPAPAYADTDPLAQQTFGPRKNMYIPTPKDGYVAGRKVGTKWLAPKTCYERKRVGPKQYVLVRRVC